MSDITKLITEKTGYAELLTELDNKLSGSELNSLLLELFRKRIAKMSAGEVLKQFSKNRFTLPSSADTVSYKELELGWLKFVLKKNFKLITLSPLAPLGACSVAGEVDQNNVVSASRGTEIVADATNVLALVISQELKNQQRHSILRYAASHRHVRGQAYSDPAFSAHFGVLCMATGGPDTGNFSFETMHLAEHLNIHLSLLSKEFDKDRMLIKIYLLGENEKFHKRLQEALQQFDDSFAIQTEMAYNSGDYYKLVRFKTFLKDKQKYINLSDGGMVDWTQKLTSNRKQRLFISGIGTELIHKILHKQIEV